MRHALSLQVGPVGFRIGSAWRRPIDQLAALYRGYPAPAIPDFTVRLEPARPWRRYVKPSIFIGGDFILPDAAPLAFDHGLLAAEMGMNLQMALGQRRFLLLHAAAVEREGRALLMTGVSGAGKSTLAALLGERGWRLMGDEFALLEMESGLIRAFPRAVSLKNEAVKLFGDVAADRLGPVMDGTPKGAIRHLRPRDDAIVRMAEPASPALLLFPRYGFAAETREIGQAEVFVRLTQASTNYVALGEPAFAALTSFVRDVPALAIDYPNTKAAVAMVERAWSERAR